MEKEIRFIVPRDKREYPYVGFDANESRTSFVFPCQYIDPDSDLTAKRAEAKKLVSLIKTVSAKYSIGGSESEARRFHAMSWLIRDFLEKGYYEERERVVGLFENGKIHWPKTIRKSRILYDNGNIIYKDFYRYKNTQDNSNLLPQIHKCALEYSVKQIGFLYGVTQTKPSSFKIDGPDNGLMLHILKEALSLTYNDYKRTLCNHLITILTGACGASPMIDLSMRDYEFEYVFEYLVNAVFGTESVRNYYNHASYVIDDKEIAASKMRPDTVMRNQGSGDPDYLVIDSKYYNYGYTRIARDLPQSASITKQISYNHYLEDMYSSDKKSFYSVFLLPFSRKETESEIVYVGYAKKELQKPSKNENKIAVCLVDLKTLVDTYSGVGRSKEYLRDNLMTLVMDRCFSEGNEV